MKTYAYKHCDTPLMTNTLVVDIDKEKFFKKYVIVSYTTGQSMKNVSYERFLDVKNISVYGKYGYWEKGVSGYTRFFVMAKREDLSSIKEDLGNIKDIRYKEDDLSKYAENDQKHIITSLCLNSLSAEFNNSHGMFSNGRLIVWNDDNFTIKQWKDRRQIVGLDIDLTSYMNLKANTKTFSKVRNLSYIKEHWKDKNRLFHVNFTKDSIYTVVPFSLRNLPAVDKEKDLYEEHSSNTSKKNIVPFWPYSTQKYKNGKLAVLWEIVGQLNNKFTDILSVKFKEYDTEVKEQCLTEESSYNIIKTGLEGCTICLEDCVGNEESMAYLEYVKRNLDFFYPYCKYEINTTKYDCKIKLISNMSDDNYGKDDTLKEENFATQHMMFEPLTDKIEKSEETESEDHKEAANMEKEDAKLRRIMLELSVKHINLTKDLKSISNEKIADWNFYEFRQIKDLNADKSIYGGKLSINREGKLEFDYFKGDFDYKKFLKFKLNIDETNQMDGKKYYHVVSKKGNTYLIISTDETPMMNVDLIESTYNEIEASDTLLESVLVAFEDAGGEPEDVKQIECYLNDNGFVEDERVKLSVLNALYKEKILPKYGKAFKNPFAPLRRGKPIVSVFKRKEEREKMLGGYQGVHVWTENENYSAFNYMVGFNASKLKITESTVIDKVPHTHKVIPLKIESKERFEDDKNELLSMLAEGLGRWNEAMNMPFPFKFLTEHIERMTLINYEQHWDELKFLC